jgi:hypothetical protein
MNIKEIIKFNNITLLWAYFSAICAIGGFTAGTYLSFHPFISDVENRVIVVAILYSIGLTGIGLIFYVRQRALQHQDNLYILIPVARITNLLDVI